MQDRGADLVDRGIPPAALEGGTAAAKDRKAEAVVLACRAYQAALQPSSVVSLKPYAADTLKLFQSAAYLDGDINSVILGIAA